MNKIFVIAGSLGLLALVPPTLYKLAVGDVALSFEKPHGRYYEFNLDNHTPVDQIIKRFTVEYPPQKPIGHTTKRIYAEVTDAGGVMLPGGNSSEIPVIDFHELDGKTLPANKITPFLMPPTNSKNFLQLDAAVFDVTYETEPANPVLSALDEGLKFVKLRNRVTMQRYLVMDNLWIPTNAPTVADAVKIACRNDDSLSEYLCAGHQGG